MQTTQNLNALGNLKRIFAKLDTAYWAILALFAILVIAAFILDSPQNIWAGLIRILTSRSLLVTDYAALGGMGAMLISAVLVGLFSLITMIIGGVKPTGGTIMGIWLILGFAFFGKNIFNTIPIVLGVLLFAKVKKLPFKDVSLTTMMCASIAPIVSEVAYLTMTQSTLAYLASPYLQIVGVSIGALVGIFVGFIFTPLAVKMGNVHGGYLLYNAGFVGGLIATFTVSLLRSGGFTITPENIWATGYTLPLSILMYVIAAFFIVLGIATSDKDRWTKFREMQKQSGRLPTDYYTMYGNIAYFNVGLLVILGTTAALLVGAPINGAVMGGIFCVGGFGVLGKNFKNVIPIMVGIGIGAYWNHNPMYYPSNILALLFGTGIAPLAGRFGIMWGIVSGFVHLSLVSFIGHLNGGLNLYNNGFAGGFVVILMIPIITAFTRKKSLEEL
jgi:hypothetical protein